MCRADVQKMRMWSSDYVSVLQTLESDCFDVNDATEQSVVMAFCRHNILTL